MQESVRQLSMAAALLLPWPAGGSRLLIATPAARPTRSSPPARRAEYIAGSLDPDSPVAVLLCVAPTTILMSRWRFRTPVFPDDVAPRGPALGDQQELTDALGRERRDEALLDGMRNPIASHDGVSEPADVLPLETYPSMLRDSDIVAGPCRVDFGQHPAKSDTGWDAARTSERCSSSHRHERPEAPSGPAPPRRPQELAGASPGWRGRPHAASRGGPIPAARLSPGTGNKPNN
jgi:hypothetical protein